MSELRHPISGSHPEKRKLFGPRGRRRHDVGLSTRPSKAAWSRKWPAAIGEHKRHQSRKFDSSDLLKGDVWPHSPEAMAAIFDTFRVKLGKGIARVNALPIHETPSTPDRKNLGLGGDFSPTRKLIAFWYRGINALGGNVPIEMSKFYLIREMALAEIKRNFSQDLVSVLADYAYRASSEQPKHVFITRLRRFEPKLQLEMCEQFYVIPDESSEFMRLLFRELTAALLSGCVVKGDWGSLNSSHYELCLHIAAQRRVAEDGFIQSTELE